MQKKDILYKEVLLRVGKTEMVGIDTLLDRGYHGIAERHAVQKMMIYVRELEDKLGISMPPVSAQTEISGEIKVNINKTSYYL